MNKSKKISKTRYATGVGVFSALAYLITLVCKLIPSVQGFLSLDAKDAIIAIASFIFGPLAAPIIAVIVAFVEFITISETGWYGFLMNFASSTVFSLTASYIYRRGKNYSSAICGFAAAIISTVAVMLCLNAYITPLYFGMPRSVVIDMLPTLLLPFNLAKAFINSALSLVLYKPIINALRAARLIPRAEYKTQVNKTTVFTFVLGAILIVIATILLVIIW